MTAAAVMTEAPRAGELLFDDGLLGFPECRSFRLMATERNGLYWLESTDCPPLAFLLADPFLFFDDYAIDLNGFDLAPLQPAAPGDIAILVTVTLNDTTGPTANLRGPIAINVATGRARQIIVGNSDRGVREPIRLERSIGG